MVYLLFGFLHGSDHLTGPFWGPQWASSIRSQQNLENRGGGGGGGGRVVVWSCHRGRVAFLKHGQSRYLCALQRFFYRYHDLATDDEAVKHSSHTKEHDSGNS